MSRPAPAAAADRRGLFWAMVPVVVLAAGVSGLVLVATIASDDPGFALERDYYQRAVTWNQQQAQWAENERLGYRLVASIIRSPTGAALVARVADRAGAPVRGAHVEVEAFANARSAARRTLSLAEGEGGAYHASLDGARPGLWELRFTVVRDGERFTHVARVELPGSAAP